LNVLACRDKTASETEKQENKRWKFFHKFSFDSMCDIILCALTNRSRYIGMRRPACLP
jgi:hypothetical protein